jgi:hypothetical protein
LKKACIVTGFFTVLRTFGAQVRAVLLDNVAAHWKVPRAELATEPSVVVHAKSGRRISYGEIVAFVELGNALLEPLFPPNGHLTTETLREQCPAGAAPGACGADARFACDSPLEGDGFELPVPVRQAKLTRFCR